MYYLNKICFVCLSNNIHLNTVIHKETHNEIKYVLPELPILYPGNPVYICFSCHTTLRSFSMFKKKCLDNYSRSNDYIKILQESNDNQNFSELQIRIINCKQLIKHEKDIHLNNEDAFMSWKEQNDQTIELEDIKEEFLAFENSADRDFYQQLVKSESVLDDIQNGGSSVLSDANNALDKQNYQQTVVEDYIVDKNELVAQKVFVIKLNNQDKNEDALLSWEEQDKCNIAVQNNIDVEEESAASEESADEELDEQDVFTLSRSVSADEQDGGSSETSEDISALDKDETNCNTNTDNQEFQCSMCKEVFIERLAFDTHLKNHVNNITGSECLICDKKIKNGSNLKRHMTYHLSIKDYQCSVCKKKFSRKFDMKKHMKIHEGIKNYQCTICNKKFLHNYHLKSHTKLHEGIKNHKCSICKRKFAQHFNLVIHMKMHEGRKDYECFKCKKKFTRSGTLKIHMKIHEGRKDYECSICKKKFTRTSNLKKHMNLHEGRKDNKCSICRKKFASSSNL